MNELTDYYQINLYKNHDSDENEESMQEFLGNKIIPLLSEHSKLIHKGMLLREECFEALKRFPNGKSSGNDSLTLLIYTGLSLQFRVVV